MVEGDLLALLIYVVCRPEWNDDIEIYAKIRQWRQEAQGVVVLI